VAFGSSGEGSDGGDLSLVPNFPLFFIATRRIGRGWVFCYLGGEMIVLSWGMGNESFTLIMFLAFALFLLSPISAFLVTVIMLVRAEIGYPFFDTFSLSQGACEYDYPNKYGVAGDCLGCPVEEYHHPGCSLPSR
jgi:hypothetical protein